MQDIEIQRLHGVPDFAGCIQPKDESWIIWLDETGKPSMYWPEREPGGGVVGEPVRL